MQHLIKLSDAAGKHLVLLTVSELEASQPAIDLVFDLIGAEDVDNLVGSKVLAEGQVEELKALQNYIFDRDNEGRFIREGINFTANGVELDPDAPLSNSFALTDISGIQAMSCELKVSGPAFSTPDTANHPALSSMSNPVISSSHGFTAESGASERESTLDAEQEEEDPMHSYAMIMLIHQLRIGRELDVTKDWPEIDQEIKECEKRGLIEIDVETASYKISPDGKVLHRKYLEEAQELIRRYDIFCDVAVDAEGRARFDTGVGKDFRVPVFEHEGLDPFRARFLLGINDGEWNNLTNWYELLKNRDWYDQIFQPIERAPTVEDIGADKIASIIDQGRAVLMQQVGSST